MNLSNLFQLLLDSGKRFSENNGMRDAAAIAYYAAFSLPSLLLITIAFIGFYVEPSDIHGGLESEIEFLAGDAATEQLEELVKQTKENDGRFVASIAGVATLLFGSTGVLVQLQSTLNQVWNVQVAPREGTWMSLIMKRILSLGMVLVIAFLLLVSIAVRAAISGVHEKLNFVLPSTYSTGLLTIADLLASFLILTVLLAAMFRFLPDASWTAPLFV